MFSLPSLKTCTGRGAGEKVTHEHRWLDEQFGGEDEEDPELADSAQALLAANRVKHVCGLLSTLR